MTNKKPGFKKPSKKKPKTPTPVPTSTIPARSTSYYTPPLRNDPWSRMSDF